MAWTETERRAIGALWTETGDRFVIAYRSYGHPGVVEKRGAELAHAVEYIVTYNPRAVAHIYRHERDGTLTFCVTIRGERAGEFDG